MSARSLVVAASVLSFLLAASPAPATSMHRGSKLVASGVPLFLPFRSFDAGISPYSVAIGDLNGDGTLDLAVANYGDTTGTYGTTVSVLLGNGDGTFGAKTQYVTGSGPDCVAIGDLNGDGKLDLAVANRQTATVSVLLGNGDGTFGAKADFGAGSGASSVAIADLNGDGKLDLAVASVSYNTVSVLLGNGDGTFGAKTDFGAGPGASSVAIADLNGDGKLDLATANEGNASFGTTVSVLLGNGDGTFGANVDYDTGANTGPISVAIADLNGDVHPDLVTADIGTGTVSVLLGNGDGTFGAKTYYAAGSQPYSVAIGDLNGDSKLDLAVANLNSGGVSVLLGNGDGTFADQTYYSPGGISISVAIGDLNGDSKLDLAVATSPNTVSVLLNGTPMFTLTATADANGSISPSGATSVSYGDSLAYTITPAPGYQVDNVVVDGWSSVGAVTSYTFTNVTADHSIAASFAGVLGVDNGRPIAWALSPVAPNPLRGAGRVAFDVPRRAQVRLVLLDLAGREVDVLSTGELAPGRFSVPLDVRSRAPGVFFLRLESAGVRLQRAVVLIR